jgi:ABC-type antimicrobial peptide transport system permease subunit
MSQLAGLSLIGLGLRNAFRRPFRTVLSVTGIALCVMLMLTVSGISQTYVTVVNQSYSIYHSDVVVVSRASLLVEGIPLGGAIPEATSTLLDGVSGVAATTPILFVVDTQQLVPKNITIGVPIQNFTMFSHVTQVQLEGSYPTSSDQVVVGSYLASTLDLSVGSTIKEGGTLLEVTGIVSTSNLILGNAVIMPLQTAQSTQGYDGLVSAILVSSAGIPPDVLSQRIDSKLPSVVAIDPAQDLSFTNPLTSSVGILSESVDVFSVTLAFLFMTIISSVNLMERKDEFYTMRAIGSSSGSMMKVALAETGLVSLTGFLSGLGLSAVAIAIAFREYAGVPYLDSLYNTFAVVPPSVAFLAGFVVVGFGMLVGAITITVMLRDMK